jgi:hypothetical protein
MVRAYARVILSASLTFSAVSFCQQPVRDGLTLPDIHAHDPWVLADQSTHTYYMYVGFYVNSSGIRRTGIETYKSKDLKSWSGPYEVFEVPKDSWANPAQGVWAPEVHLYKNHYYLFATLNNYDKPLAKEGDASKDTQINIVYHGGGQHLRGTQVFVSDTPEGPFKTIVDSPIAPSNLMTLDGTFYQEDGVPYMVYAHEWVQLLDGTIEAIRMKEDLSAADGKPFYLFKASDAPWLADRHDAWNTPQVYVTDGPELYRTRNGVLLMLWSSYRQGLYVEALAHSDNGKLSGHWKQDGVLVGEDSGHGMLFRDFEGRLMLILHQPFDGRLSRAKLFEVEDTGDSIRIKK